MGESCRALLGHDPVSEGLELLGAGESRRRGDVPEREAHQPLDKGGVQAGPVAARLRGVWRWTPERLLPAVDCGRVWAKGVLAGVRESQSRFCVSGIAAVRCAAPNPGRICGAGGGEERYVFSVPG